MTKEALSQCPQCGIPLDFKGSTPLSFCPTCQLPLMLIAGKYRLEKLLAEGGFGKVFLGYHAGLKGPGQKNWRVVKVIKPEIFEVPGVSERFFREVQVTANLSEQNDHVVRIYDDFGEEPLLGHYYVMEYLRGQTLQELLKGRRRKPLDLSLAFHIFYQLCNAMAAAHRSGIIHRDLKPENIQLIQRGADSHFAKVLDFGLAKPLEQNQEAKSKGLVGTPAYMSPEQCSNQEIDARSDIYSLGVIFYEMLTGNTPFGLPHDRTIALIFAHMKEIPKPFAEAYPGIVIDEGLERAVMRSLAKSPAERYESTEDFWYTILKYAPQDRNYGPLSQDSANYDDGLSTARMPGFSSESLGGAPNLAFLKNTTLPTGDGSERPLEDWELPVANDMDLYDETMVVQQVESPIKDTQRTPPPPSESASIQQNENWIQTETPLTHSVSGMQISFQSQNSAVQSSQLQVSFGDSKATTQGSNALVPVDEVTGPSEKTERDLVDLASSVSPPESKKSGGMGWIVIVLAILGVGAAGLMYKSGLFGSFEKKKPRKKKPLIRRALVRKVVKPVKRKVRKKRRYSRTRRVRTAIWNPSARAVHVRGNERRTGSYKGSRAPGGKLFWRFSTRGRIRTEPLLHRGVVYFGSDDRKFYALKVRRKRLLWSFTTKGAIRGGAALSGQVVLFGSRDGHLYAVDKSSGKMFWKYRTRSAIVSSPVVYNGKVYVTSTDHYLYALDFRTGRKAWRVKVRTATTPALYKGVLYAVGRNGTCYAVHAQKGRVLWRKRVGSGKHTAPAISRGKLYFGSSKGILYKVSARSRSVKKHFRGKGRIVGAPGVRSWVVFVGTTGNKLLAIHSGSKGLQWSLPTNSGIQAAPAVGKEAVYVGSDDGKFHAVHRKSGQLLWSFSAKGKITASPVLGNGFVIFGSWDRSLYVLK